MFIKTNLIKILHTITLKVKSGKEKSIQSNLKIYSCQLLLSVPDSIRYAIRQKNVLFRFYCDINKINVNFIFNIAHWGLCLVNYSVHILITAGRIGTVILFGHFNTDGCIITTRCRPQLRLCGPYVFSTSRCIPHIAG